MGKPGWFLQFVFLFILGAFACPHAPAAQIQGQPVGVIYNLQGGSWDAFNKYPASSSNTIPLDGQRMGNISHLGAKWNRSQYVDGPNAFGVIAFDQFGPMFSPAYANGQQLLGLNKGYGAWNGFYVDRVNAFPAIVDDGMTNYVNGELLDGLNAGINNGSLLVWSGAYEDHCVIFPPSLVYTGGVVIASVTVPGYDTIYMTFDGTTPTTSPIGPTSLVPYSLAPPAGTYTYDGALTLPFNATVQAVQGHGLYGFCGVATLLNALNFGENWSNNVVANGGASPSIATVTNLTIFGAGLNNDGLLNQSLGATPSIWHLNAIASDSLIAGLTPQIYYFGNQPWVNHNFVLADLTVNGFTGDGATKYADTGFNPATVFNASKIGGLSSYAYVAAGASGFTLAANIGGTALYLEPKFTDLNAYTGDSIDTITVVGSPGDGFYSGNRTGASTHLLYFANSGTGWASVGTSAAVAVTTYPNGAIYFLAQHFNATINNFSSSTCSYVSLHNGFSSASGQKEYNHVQTLRTALGGGFR